MELILAGLVTCAIIYFALTIHRADNNSTSDAQSVKVNVEGSIFYHEDDFCQVEILPNENFNSLIKQADNVQEFTAKHFNGVAYSDMMIRDNHEMELSERGIKPIELETILSQLESQRHASVTTGITPGEMASENTIGFGKNYRGLFYDFESDIVKNIWIAGFLEVDLDKQTKVLNQLGEKWNLLLIDWNSLTLIDLKDKNQINKYLNKQYD